MHRIFCSMLLASSLVSAGSVTVAAQQPGSQTAQSWPQKKCAFYAKAWRELLELSSRTGVTDGFIRGNVEFIAAGCSNGADVCPASKADIDLANQLTMAAMNFGTASSFLPFICRQSR